MCFTGIAKFASYSRCKFYKTNASFLSQQSTSVQWGAKVQNNVRGNDSNQGKVVFMLEVSGFTNTFITHWPQVSHKAGI